LIDAGWPREALLITVVRDKKGEGHAVLTVKSDKGEFILDNQNEDVVAWTETGYRFVKRQSQTDAQAWVSLGDSRPAVATAS
ncbi:transglutaminase-like cysteine peptidase, partial [Acinetobacter baumannii]